MRRQAGLPPVAFAPNGEPIDIVNHFVNFGWEYVYHCHLLAHEEMDMMHGMVIAVPPLAPSGLAVTVQGNKATLKWTDNSLNETSFTVQGKTGAAGAWTTMGTVPAAAGTGTTVTFQDPNNLANRTTYHYRVVASNTVGDTWDYSDPNLNEGAAFPTMTVDSAFSNVVTVTRR